MAILDAHICDAFMHYMDGYTESASHVDRIHAVGNIAGQVITEIVLFLALAPVQLAKLASQGVMMIGRISIQVIEMLARFGRLRRTRLEKGVEALPEPKPVPELKVRDTSKSSSKPAPAVMEKFKPACFKPSDGLKDTFKDNPRKMEKEFYRQLKDQEAGINNMSVGQYLENRKQYTDLIDEYGNEKARQILTNGGKAQKAARAELENEISESVRDSLARKGIRGKKAKAMVEEKVKVQMKQLAALHDPDMIAGGKDEISRVGNKNVNSSLGSQWKDRVSEMDKAAQKALKAHGPDAKMNVELNRCKH